MSPTGREPERPRPSGDDLPAAGTGETAPVVTSAPLPLALRLLLVLLLLGLVLFCVFGFLATLEPLPGTVRWGFRAIYLLVGTLGLGGMAWLLLPAGLRPGQR